jgi:hypothetical protein
MKARVVSLCFLLLTLTLTAPATEWTRHYVVDARLSTLRTRPDLAGPLLKRLRVGRTVFEVGRARDREARFWLRVAVTRRTRGWILADAVARPGDVAGERRLLTLLDGLEGVDRIEVARLAADRFPVVRAVARDALEDEAVKAAPLLSERARRRLGALHGLAPERVRALMLSDPGLDRFNRLRVYFDVDTETLEFVPRPGSRGSE